MKQEYIGMFVGFLNKIVNVSFTQYENGLKQAKGKPNGCIDTDYLTILHHKFLTFQILTAKSNLYTSYLPLNIFMI